MKRRYFKKSKKVMKRKRPYIKRLLYPIPGGLYKSERFEKVSITVPAKITDKDGLAWIQASDSATVDSPIGTNSNNNLALFSRYRHTVMRALSTAYEVIGISVTYGPGNITASTSKSTTGVVIGGGISGLSTTVTSQNQISTSQFRVTGSATGSSTTLYVPKQKLLISTGANRQAAQNEIFASASGCVV